MSESIKFSVDLPVSPERVFRAWLDGYEFSQFTGKAAQVDPTLGGRFTILDGEARGRTMVATPFSHIVQSWRDRDFPPGSPDSQVDLKLEPTCLGSQVTLSQDGIPEGHSRQVLQKWEKEVFRPLLAYFEELVGDTAVDMDG